MSQATLFDKIWDLHTVGTLETGETQLFIGLHLIHEVTSPQAFQMLEERGLPVLHPERTFATVDHIVPTDRQVRPLSDPMAEQMYGVLERNVARHGIAFFGLDSEYQGIVHVIGPELGLTQPGMTIACGDSHTSTHGAFGTIAFGIGTTQVSDVLATQTLAATKPKVRRIRVDGALGPGVYAKDIILSIIATLGVKGGIGYAYEYAGAAIDALSMDERMSICNMSIEGGARVGYVNPDRITADYVRGRPHAPSAAAFSSAEEYWRSIASGADASFDDEVMLRADEIEPVVTWGINPGQSVGVSDRLPRLTGVAADERDTAAAAYRHMGLTENDPIAGTRIDVAFIGSCTNSRLTDLREAARVVRGHKVDKRVKALVVPGSQADCPAGRRRGAAGDLHRGRVRVARRRLFHVSGDERRQAGRRPGQRVLLQPQLHRPPGLRHRPHPADEPGHGRRRRRQRRRHRRTPTAELMKQYSPRWFSARASLKVCN